jgi:hypothetical protein
MFFAAPKDKGTIMPNRLCADNIFIERSITKAYKLLQKETEYSVFKASAYSLSACKKINFNK